MNTKDVTVGDIIHSVLYLGMYVAHTHYEDKALISMYGLLLNEIEKLNYKFNDGGYLRNELDHLSLLLSDAVREKDNVNKRLS